MYYMYFKLLSVLRSAWYFSTIVTLTKHINKCPLIKYTLLYITIYQHVTVLLRPSSVCHTRKQRIYNIYTNCITKTTQCYSIPQCTDVEHIKLKKKNDVCLQERYFKNNEHNILCGSHVSSDGRHFSKFRLTL